MKDRSLKKQGLEDKKDIIGEELEEDDDDDVKDKDIDDDDDDDDKKA